MHRDRFCPLTSSRRGFAGSVAPQSVRARSGDIPRLLGLLLEYGVRAAA